MKYEVLEKVLAIFNPLRLDTLIDENKKYLGEHLVFSALWIIEEGTYKGQWAFECDQIKGWVPEEDLEVINCKNNGETRKSK